LQAGKTSKHIEVCNGLKRYEFPKGSVEIMQPLREMWMKARLLKERDKVAVLKSEIDIVSRFE